MKEFIEKLIGRLEEERKKYTSEYGLIDIQVQEVFVNVRKIVKELAEEYNNGWISCKERLPSEEELVLLQTKRDGRMYVGYHRRNGAKWVCVTARNSTVTGMIPIAWQPLPQPYKEGSADNA